MTAAPLLVTHDHCLDGATCGVLGQAAGWEVAFVYPDGVEAYLRQVAPDRPVVLADVSLSLAAYPVYAERLLALIDHHQSALGLRGRPRVHLDLDHCASTLLYRWLTATGRLDGSAAWDPLLALVEDYDLWRPDHVAGERLNRLFRDQGWEWFRTKFAAGYAPLTPDEETRLAALEEEEHTFVARHLELADRFQASGRRLAVVVLQGEGAVNEVAHALIQEGQDAAFLIKPDGRISCRTTGVVDAARLMERGFGGGGHPRAAGGRLPAESGWPRPDAVIWFKGRLQDLLTVSS